MLLSPYQSQDLAYIMARTRSRGTKGEAWGGRRGAAAPVVLQPRRPLSPSPELGLALQSQRPVSKSR